MRNFYVASAIKREFLGHYLNFDDGQITKVAEYFVRALQLEGHQNVAMVIWGQPIKRIVIFDSTDGTEYVKIVAEDDLDYRYITFRG